VTLNLKRLRYFWAVVREGTLRQAGEYLHVSEPAVSVQLKKLEQWMGDPLFRRDGRRLALTELGQVVFEYADQIFALSEELTDVVRSGQERRNMRMRVGVTETIPKSLVAMLLGPALELGGVEVLVREDDLDRLIADLALHALELVLSDQPSTVDSGIRIFSHRLGRSSVAVLGTPELGATISGPLTASGGDVPWLLPTEGSPVRRDLERWFAVHEIRPTVAGEFQDSALLKVFAGQGHGLIAIPTVVADEVCRQYGVEVLATLDGVEEAFFGLTVERKISHPGVQAVLDRVPDIFDSASGSGDTGP
jgi:LysR family transcriptional activator of nhaA